ETNGAQSPRQPAKNVTAPFDPVPESLPRGERTVRAKPSPLAGEGGSALSAETAEGAAAGTEAASGRVKSEQPKR
ncbi:hypothetical protein, partial [Rhodoblastus sp.]|uniref:hypothetical protein n=1 Tax=Rhodoblastus sp. TaxID=1962975 RepID=UPI003F9C3C19